MACTESTWACEPSSIIAFRPSYANCSCSSDGLPPCPQNGQSTDVQSSSVENHRKVPRFRGQSWQDSFDFQEFGFLYNVSDVAPADELFYKGRILPLQTGTRHLVVQSPSTSCMREELTEVTPQAGRPSCVSRDDEVKFKSCKMECAVYDKAINGNALGAMRSLSFRSHHSGYWETSGGEKDTTDTSTSSRDSNGSSQDSDLSNAHSKLHSNLKVKPSLVPWKVFFGGLMRASRREHDPHPRVPLVAFSEDLSKYRPIADVGQDMAGVVTQDSLHDGVKAEPAMLSEGVDNGGLRGKSELKGTVDDGKPMSKFGLKGKELKTSTTQHLGGRGVATRGKFLRFGKGRSKSKCTNTDMSGGEELPEQRRVGVKTGRWQVYARKLKPLCEVKKGLMVQFRMEDCGKNACEVQSGIVRRPSWHRKLSRQPSFSKNHKLSMEHEPNDASCPYASSNNTQVAMSSCPPSTMSSPSHNGVLVVAGDSKAKLLQRGINRHRATGIKTAVNNECISVSTMHELHSAVQSAIAHCKESNRGRYLD